eukprot:TRINITY_DN3358_c1_g1_i1.p1 TRINITY_DN3358_c1_g1~~TRINITY_DN3358_c1_g1_i1.p1  ORF type:complete len:530 (-),score=84.78 TRINITY_DN3358_c1_g1_i1:44-1633(-)
MNKILLLNAILVGCIAASSITVGFWGQKSSDQEQNLLHYCAESNWDVINVAFVSEFGSSGYTEVNLAGHTAVNCRNNGDCTSVGNEVTACQQTYGKKVLLSLGGAAGNYGLASASQANDVADEIWNKFLGGNGAIRPFGPSAIFDGVDFDIETPNQVTGASREPQAAFYATLATRLRSHFSSSNRNYYVSASPQCVYPDAMLGPDGTKTGTLLTAAQVDWANIQFYNNGFDRCDGCNIFGSSYATRLGQWASWAASKQSSFLIGVPGADQARFADSSSYCQGGYVSLQTLESALSQACSSYANFGGLMIFDVSAEEVSGGQTYIGSATSYTHGLSCGRNPLGSSGPTSTVATTATSSTRSPSSTRSSTTSSTRSSTTSTSAQTPTTSAPGCSQSGTPSTGSCPTSGYMQCVGSNYQTCTNGQWSGVQACAQGTACSPSGNYIYCLSCSQLTGTTSSTQATSSSTTSSSNPITTSSSGGCLPDGSTDGHSECTGTSTYHICDHGAWSADQSCQSGLRCSASGAYVYCIQP